MINLTEKLKIAMIKENVTQCELAARSGQSQGNLANKFSRNDFKLSFASRSDKSSEEDSCSPCNSLLDFSVSSFSSVFSFKQLSYRCVNSSCLLSNVLRLPRIELSSSSRRAISDCNCGSEASCDRCVSLHRKVETWKHGGLLLGELLSESVCLAVCVGRGRLGAKKRLELLDLIVCCFQFAVVFVFH